MTKNIPLVYIVSRDRWDLYERLKCRVDDDTQVVLDRRRGERRRDFSEVSVEQRSTERRVKDVRADLARRGWAILWLDGAVDPRPGGLAPGDRVILRRYSPTLPQRLIGRSGRVLDIRRVRADVHFDGEPLPRRVELTDLAPVSDVRPLSE